jgi:signal transduction histidine kinase
MAELKAAMLTEMESEGADNMFLRLVDRNGQAFVLPAGSGWRDADQGKAFRDRLSGEEDHYFETLVVPHRQYPFRLLTARLTSDTMIQMAESLESDQHLLKACREVLSLTLGVVVLFSALGGFLFARRALSGVEEVTRTANEISKGAFDRRVEVQRKGDEIDTLAETFNIMVGKIEVLIKGMKEMTDNIAHDLKSPITRIRGVAETALTGGKSPKDLKFVPGSIIEECDRLLVMINTMLDISEAEAGVAEWALGEVDLAQVIRDACDLFQPVAENNQVQMIQNVSGNTTLSANKTKI